MALTGGVELMEWMKVERPSRRRLASAEAAALEKGLPVSFADHELKVLQLTTQY